MNPAALDGFPRPWSIGTRLAEGRWRGRLAAHWARVGDITLEGRPLRDEPYRTQTPLRHDYRLSKKFNEVLAVARILAFDEQSGDLLPAERPDVIAYTAIDGAIGVEVAEITDTAPHSAVLDDIRRQIRARIEDLGIAPRAGLWFWFNLDVAARNGVGANCPASDSARFLPRGRDRQRTLDEMTEIVASGIDGKGELIDGSSYPTLSRYGVRFAAVTGSFVEIGEGAIGYSPSSLIPTAGSMLAQKRDKARAYGFPGPLWLVMHIMDRRGEFYETAQDFAESRPQIEPFDRVHLLYREMLMVLDCRFGGWMRLVIKRGR
ncbi:MAG: hypothetical protein ABSA52_23035 [Candidatus Binatia bacterium]|jgi:hypothetical protein